ncbi:MAG TPA: nucleotidyl transferase AbiEii/AbiGii toxin family protein [Nocardioides sp.]|nr:nucleotidyl transferase AbiEii/AbiGii toxin family protein [Nocardioides sp.]
MSDEHLGSRLAALLRTLKPKTKEPVSAKVLNTWIAQAEGKLGDEAKGGRLGWLIASSVAIAAVQRAIDAAGRHLFLLKGGTLLQHRLPATARTTKDVDGLIRGDLDQFIFALDEALDEPWGPLTLRRGEVEVVNVPTKIIKPRRFDIILDMRGVTWRRIQFEVSPDEAGISEEHETIEPPPLAGFGLPDPDALVGIAMRFQIAQKLHAVSDPHEPPDSINDRARDVVDLLLLRDLAASTGSPELAEIRQAAMAVFAARIDEAAQLGLATRAWPPTLLAHPHWTGDFARAAASGGVGLSLDAAVAEVNAWINEIELVGLIDDEARAAEDAEATSDPDEPLPPHVKVTRGRSPRTDRD